MSGLDAIPLFRRHVPESKIIILTQSNTESDILRAIACGASGYLFKSSTVRQIKDGIRTVMEGGVSGGVNVLG
jgi:two-component system nitrate/nitrite response regulator NarL